MDCDERICTDHDERPGPVKSGKLSFGQLSPVSIAGGWTRTMALWMKSLFWRIDVSVLPRCNASQDARAIVGSAMDLLRIFVNTLVFCTGSARCFAPADANQFISCSPTWPWSFASRFWLAPSATWPNIQGRCGTGNYFAAFVHPPFQQGQRSHPRFSALADGKGLGPGQRLN
jgi:hypothetical protein